MLRIVEHGARVAAFDDLALLHDHDAVADVVGGGEIVRDVDDRDPSSSRSAWNRLTIDMRSEASTIDTGSSATISAGAGDQRARDRDALQLAARQLVREAAADFGERQADLLQRLVGWPRSSARRASAGEAPRR